MKTVISFAISILWIGFAPLCQRTVQAVSIAINGDWNLSISANQILSGKSSYSSAPNQIRLRISDSSGDWKVYVRKEDTNWHINFVLKVRKTSGQPKPIVTVQDTDTEFFSGNKDHNYSIQLILEGVSVLIPPDTYTTRVIYTITDE